MNDLEQSQTEIAEDKEKKERIPINWTTVAIIVLIAAVSGYFMAETVGSVIGSIGGLLAASKL